MSEIKEKLQYKESEIDILDLILTIWNRKTMIISITIIFSLLSGLFSFFVLSPVYNTKLNIIISMPEAYETRYGNYSLPITTNEQYLNLITSNNVLLNTIKDMGYNENNVPIELLQRKITVDNTESIPGIVRNTFNVSVSADNPEESLKLAQVLFDNYKEFMDYLTKEMAVNYYYDNFNVQLKSLEVTLEMNKEILQENEELLSHTPKYLGEGNNVEIHSELNSKSDYVVPINSINPNYIKIENDIIDIKQDISSIESSMRARNEYIKHLDLEKLNIEKYNETGVASSRELSIIDVVDTSIYLSSAPVAPTLKTSPNNILIILIGAIIGCIIGVLISWINEYWIKGKLNKL